MGIQLVIAFVLLFSPHVFAASCCGGGASLASLNTSDFKQKFQSSFATSLITHFSDHKGNISSRSLDNQQLLEEFSVNYSKLIKTYWQWGIGLKGAQKTLKTQEMNEFYQGLSELSLLLGYEFLPELSYSLWKPRGFVYIIQSIPLSQTLYSTIAPSKIDVLGRSFSTTQLGFLFSKVIGSHDISVNSAVSRGWSTKNQNGKTVTPGIDLSTALSYGYSPVLTRWRFGTSLSYSFFSAQSDIESTRSSFVLALSGNVQYSAWENTTLGLSLTDQGFLATAENSALSKILNLSLTRSF